MEMITYLKRRFSSGDLQGEAADKREHEGLPNFLRFGSSTSTTGQSTQSNQTYPNASHAQYKTQQNKRQESETTGVPQTSYSGGSTQPSNQNRYQQSGVNTSEDTPGPVRRGRGTYPSAPTSPTRSHSSSFMGPMSGITGQISSTVMRGFSSAASAAQSMTTGRTSANKERYKIILVIDDSQTDWCKYFKGHKILGDWEIRVEQAQFSEITMTAYNDQGCVINIHHGPNRSKFVKSFKPDFVLLRQHASGANEDWQPILTGLMYSRTPCMNSLHAVYNMKNRPWLFAHLLLLRNRLGKESFPLISQVYYTSHMEMVTAPSFPTIVKVGIGYGGEGKIRSDNPISFQDVISMMVSMNTYATAEPFVDAKCDVHVQKIGTQYKAFARKSISGHWKSNTGSAILEKIPMNDRFKLWTDEVSRMFGGLDICSVSALQSKTGEYFIYEVGGSDMTLFGESQEEDRREIAELAIQRMQTVCAQTTMTKASSLQSVGQSAEIKRPQPATTTVVPSMQPIPTTQFAPSPHPPVRQTNITTQPPSSYQAPTPVQQQSFTQPMSQSQPPPHQQPFRQPAPVTTSSTFGPSAQSTGSNIGTWNEQGSLSSISSSGGSVSSSFTGMDGQKIDGIPSGWQSGPTAAVTSEPGRGLTQTTYESGYTTRQSPFFPATSVTHSVSGSHADSSGPDKMIDSDRNAHWFSYDSGDSFDKFASSRRSDQESESCATPTGLSFEGNTAVRSHSSSDSYSQGTPTQTQRPFVPPRQTSLRTGASSEDADDTMKNLRKTFAGIFGDM